MAGVVRASDRVAFWHEAAEEQVGDPSFEELKKKLLTSPSPSPTSMPPSGAKPSSAPPGQAHQNVTIPNSNKFKTPANNLKNLLSAQAASPELQSEHKSQIQSWIKNHSAFAKSYFKPHYQDALKAQLGADLYGHLVKNLPSEHAQALNTHGQLAAPKSHKFTTPANGLKKLLDNPDTTPEHVQQWMDSHQGFVKGYLHNISYADAIKGHLGEQNVKSWGEHLLGKAPAQPKNPTVENIENTMGQVPGFKVKTPDEFFHDHVPPSQSQPAGQQVGPHHNQYTDPSQLKKNEPHPEGDTSTESAEEHEAWPGNQPQAPKKLPTEGEFNSDPEDLIPQPDIKPREQEDWEQQLLSQPKTLSFDSQAFVKDYAQAKGIDPGDVSLQGAYNLTTPQGAQDFLKAQKKVFPESAAALQEVFDKHFGRPKAQAPATKPDVGAKPPDEFFDGLVGNKHGFDQELADYYKSLSPQEWEQKTKGYAVNPPEPTSAWADVMEGLQAQQPKGPASLEELTPEGMGAAPATKVETDQHAALVQGIKKIFPNTSLDLDHMSVPELQKQLQTWHQHLDPETFPDHHPQVAALHDEHFGQGAAPETPWHDGLTDDQLSELMSVNPTLSKDLWANAPLESAQNALKNIINDKSNPEMSQKMQQFYDKHFGQGAQAQPTEQPGGFVVNPEENLGPNGEPLESEAYKGFVPGAYQQDFLKTWPVAKGDGPQAALNADPTKAKAYLENIIAPENDYSPGDQVAAQKLHDKWFGPGVSPPRAKITPHYQTLIDGVHSHPEWPVHDYADTMATPEFQSWFDGLSGPDQEHLAQFPGQAHKAYLKSLGVAPDGTLKKLLQGQPTHHDVFNWLEAHPDVAAALKDPDNAAHEVLVNEMGSLLKPYLNKGAYPAMFAGEESAPPAAAPTPFDVKALNKDIADIYGSSGVMELGGSPEDIKKNLEGPDWLGDTGDSPENLKKLQAVYDKYFGGSKAPQQAPFVGGLDFATALNEASGNWGDPDLISQGGLKFKDMTPEQAKKAVQWFIDSKWEQGHHNDTLTALYNKYWGGAGTPDNVLTHDQAPTQEQLVAIGIEPDTATSILQHGPEGFWKSWAVIKAKQEAMGVNFAAPGNYPPSHAWNKIINHFTEAGAEPTATPSGPSGYDGDSFAAEYAAIFPNSSWLSSNVGSIKGNADFAKAKLESLLGPGGKFSGGVGGGNGQKVQALYQKYFGQGQTPSQGGQASAWDPAEAKKDWLKIFSGDNATFDQKMATPEQAKAWAESAQGQQPTKVQKFLDKWFGGDQPAAPAKAFDLSTTPTAEQLIAAGVDPEKAVNIAQQSPEGFQKNYQWAKAHPGKVPQWDAIAKWVDAAGGAGTSAGYDGPSLAWMKNHYPGAGASMGQAQVEKWWSQGGGPNSSAGNKWMNDAFGDKADFQAGAPAGQSAWGEEEAKYGPPVPQPWDPTAYQAEYHAQIPGSGWSADGKSQQQAAQKLQQVLEAKIQNWGDTPQTKKQIAFYEKWFGPWKGSAPPAPPPSPFDVNELVSGLQQADPIYYGEPGVVTDLTGQSKQWHKDNLLALIQQGKEGNYLPEETAQYQALYDKYFGSEDDDTTDISAIKSDMGDLPPPEPSKPFKSEALKPEDLTNWAAHKPATEAQWKDFSAWWGNTQVTPEQEQGLYKAWFGKDANPEMASAWFGQQYEHHSQPSEGDLGMTAGTPGWAYSSWAFGKQADKAWPVFQQWATKDPGIPKKTTLKQKVLIWNGLTATEKKAIGENYVPEHPVDAKAVVAELAKAYPDSDFSKWAKLPQGDLHTSVQSLAQAGYVPAIPIFNHYFGGDIPVPKPEKPGKKPKPKAAPPSPVLPASQIPDWVKTYSQNYGNWGTGQSAAKHYTNFKSWADSIGKGDIAASGKGPSQSSWYSHPLELLKQWNEIPAPLRNQMATMAKKPWHDEEGFKNWLAAQPTLLSEVKALYPTTADDNYSWNYGESYQKDIVQKYLKMETDPQKKQALLGVYQKYFGANKPTLAEALAKAEPTPLGVKTPDWDKYLQTTSPEVVAKLIKKKIKTETNPEKFIQFADIWAKYFSGPPGHKMLSGVLGKNYGGGQGLSLGNLKSLYMWKKQGGTDSYLPYQGNYASDSPYITQADASGQQNGSWPMFFGWTPPSGSGETSTYQADPALFATSAAPQQSYAVPPTTKGSKEYQGLVESLSNFAPGLFSDKDRETLKTDSFQNWFNHAAPDYRKEMSGHPGIALDDYAGFMAGGPAYGAVDQAAGGKKVDVTPFANVPEAHSKDVIGRPMPQGLTHNQPRMDLEFPFDPDAQETLPGVDWAPQYTGLPIYRAIPREVLDLDAEPQLSSRFDHLPARQKAFELEKQRTRLRRIDQIINGPNAKRDFTQDRKHFEDWGTSHKVPAKDMKDLEDELFSNQPTLSSDEKWKIFEEWGGQHHVDPTDLYSLADKLGVGNPGQAVPGTQGTYDHPELAELIMDYLENGRGSTSVSGNQGGLGVHWTRAKDLMYSPKDSGGIGGRLTNQNGRKIPLFAWGLWGGQGEASEGTGGAYGPTADSEREHNLLNGAPVYLRRLQIRDPSGDYHDLINPGPISTWGRGRDESSQGRKLKDRDSLAERLDYDLGGKHDPKEWDTLVPGIHTDAMFARLAKEKGLLNPTGTFKTKLTSQQQETKDRLLKVYRQFFVGRPDLPGKDDVRLERMASIQTISPEVLGSSPQYIYEMAKTAGIPHPERYGAPSQLATLETRIDVLAALERPLPSVMPPRGASTSGPVQVHKRRGILSHSEMRS